MSQSAIYWPMIAQVALTFVAYVVMGMRRTTAVKSGAAQARDFKVPNDPELSATAARNVSNQFELRCCSMSPAWLSFRQAASIHGQLVSPGSLSFCVSHMPGCT